MGAIIRGTGDARNPMLISVACLCVFRIVWNMAALYVCNDIMAIYVSYPVSWLLDLVCLVTYYQWKCPLARRGREKARGTS